MQNERFRRVCVSPFSRLRDHNWLENRDPSDETGRPRRLSRNRMEDIAFSQTLKKLSLRGAALSPRRDAGRLGALPRGGGY